MKVGLRQPSPRAFSIDISLKEGDMYARKTIYGDHRRYASRYARRSPMLKRLMLILIPTLGLVFTSAPAQAQWSKMSIVQRYDHDQWIRDHGNGYYTRENGVINLDPSNFNNQGVNTPPRSVHRQWRLAHHVSRQQ